MIESLDLPVVLQKMLEYANLLTDRQGQTLFDAYGNSPHLTIHPWQDLQFILSAFICVASTSTI